MVAANKETKTVALRVVLAAGFLVGLLAILYVANLQGGKKRIREDIWFTPIAGNGVGHTADALFLGTSRVSASIQAAVFDQILSQTLHHQIQSANLGMGGSTTSEYVLGLRRVQELNPEAIRGSVVFIEAPVGYAEYRTWKDSWLIDQTPELLSRYLTRSDLPDFLLKSNTPTHQKLVVAADVLFGAEENISRLRTTFRAWFDAATFALVASFLPAPQEGNVSDLATGGGIQVDRKSVEKARGTAMAHIRQELSNQEPRRDWDASTIHSLVEKVRELGAQPIFYEMPLSREMASMYATPVRQQDRVAFQEALVRWKVPMLSPRIATTDEDFPDIWHLRKSRAQEFTQALTVDFLEKFVVPALRAAQPPPKADSTKIGA